MRTLPEESFPPFPRWSNHPFFFCPFRLKPSSDVPLARLFWFGTFALFQDFLGWRGALCRLLFLSPLFFLFASRRRNAVSKHPGRAGRFLKRFAEHLCRSSPLFLPWAKEGKLPLDTVAFPPAGMR